ncbi:MAG: thermonuclease family protein [Candidatus Omnitrophica bacterium]|nr:thermonuclease family protein [Candidatus Omnitrophota bacterium]
MSHSSYPKMDRSIKRNASLKHYSVLKDRVRQTLLAGQREIEREKVLIYWNTGKLINEHVRLNNGRADYAERVILRLEADLGIDETVLRRTAQFQAAFPIRAPGRELTWSHYKALLPVKDESERKRLAELAESKRWNWQELAERIQQTRYQKGRLPAGISDPLVEPKAGIPGLYRVIKSEDSLAIDLGFASYIDLSKSQSRGLKEGDIVSLRGAAQTRPKQSRSGIASPRFAGLAMTKGATVADLYCYPAELIRVVDGDTLWMKVWLAAPMWIIEKLRLRGIDAPELGTPEGEAAKRFLTSVLNQTRAITITTTKPDKWDRYLSDIFLEMKDGELIYLNNHLLENGHAFRYDRVQLTDWNVEG